MTIEVRAGTVRLQPDDWHALVEDHSPLDQHRPDLAAVPGLLQAIEAARQPVLQLQLDIASASLHTRHHAWIDLEAVALLVQVKGREHQLMAMPPSFLAGALARLVRLAPHTAGPRRPRDADSELLDDLFHDNELRRSSAHQVLGTRWAWMLATGSDAEHGHRLAVLEDDEGAWLVSPGTNGWQLVPTTSTVLWRRFTSLLTDCGD